MEDTPYNKLYSMEHIRKMVGGQTLLSLNVPFDRFLDYSIKQIKAGEPLLFSADVTRDKLRDEGLLIKDILNYDLVFDSPFHLNKAERLQMRDTSLTHCMLFVGADFDQDEKPVKWKVENSWGTKVGKSGFFVMCHNWFEDNVYQIILPKESLEPEELKCLEGEPVVLPLWHPMG
jgi:bleomycin hydrolase